MNGIVCWNNEKVWRDAFHKVLASLVGCLLQCDRVSSMVQCLAHKLKVSQCNDFLNYILPYQRIFASHMHWNSIQGVLFWDGRRDDDRDDEEQDHEMIPDFWKRVFSQIFISAVVQQVAYRWLQKQISNSISCNLCTAKYWHHFCV